MNNTEIWCIDCGERSGFLGKHSALHGNHFADMTAVACAEDFLARHETVSHPTPRVHRLLFVRSSDVDARALPVDMELEYRERFDG